jgi:hypothetical protein
MSRLTALIERMPTWARVIGGAALGLTALGVFYGIFLGGFPSIWKAGRESDWSWWQYALAVPALGLAYLVAEAVFYLIFAPLLWGGQDNPPWKRAIFFAFVFVIGAALLIGPLWIAHQ